MNVVCIWVQALVKLYKSDLARQKLLSQAGVYLNRYPPSSPDIGFLSKFEHMGKCTICVVATYGKSHPPCYGQSDHWALGAAYT